jgi:hypothetical protein
MESSNQTVSPLRQRMLEDRRMRQLAPKTQLANIRAVSRFGEFLGKSPHTARSLGGRRKAGQKRTFSRVPDPLLASK